MITQNRISGLNPRFDSGFTLIELVAVILLIGIISSTVASKAFNSSDSALQSSRDDVVAAARFAQQQAMDTNGTIQLVTTATTVSVTRNGTALQFGSVSYPLTLSKNVTLAPATTLLFNRLGEVPAQVFSLSSGGQVANVSLSSAGYAQ